MLTWIRVERTSVWIESETFQLWVISYFINYKIQFIFDDQIGAGSRLWCVDKILCGYEKRCNLLLEISRRCRWWKTARKLSKVFIIKLKTLFDNTVLLSLRPLLNTTIKTPKGFSLRKNTFELYADEWADAQPKDHIIGVTLGMSKAIIVRDKITENHFRLWFQQIPSVLLSSRYNFRKGKMVSWYSNHSSWDEKMGSRNAKPKRR